MNRRLAWSGIISFFFMLFGGAYISGIIPDDSWLSMPFFITRMICLASSILIFIAGTYEDELKKMDDK